MRAKVYVSGPLTSSGDPKENVDVAIEYGRELIRLGYAPMIPHLTYYLDPDARIPHETWMDVDTPWVACADAVLRIPGTSNGADHECREAMARGIPVVSVSSVGDAWPQRLAAVCPPQWHPATDEFGERATALVRLHQRKAADYGSESDPLANLRASEALGIEAWRGAYIRLRDKVFRLDQYYARGSLRNESVRDSLDDLASYALLVGILHDQQ